MAQETFHLTTITRLLAPAVNQADAKNDRDGEMKGIQLGEALGYPEISALADTERHCLAALQAKAKVVLEDGELSPAVTLHRRRLVIEEPTVDEVEIVLEPPKRSPEWQEPVTLRLPVVRWVEAGDLHQAYVPSLGIQVFAPRKPLLDERIKEHVRLVLLGRRKKLRLRDLVQLAQAESLKLGKLEVPAKIASPREVAANRGAEQEKLSMLETLAEALPPVVPPAKAGLHNPHSPPGSGQNAAVPAAAFEMEAELAKLGELLAGTQRRSVLLVGLSGSGKSALVRELARRRSEFGFGQTLFWSTNGARLMTGPIGFGMWQERCQKLCAEAAKTGSILHLGNLGELLEVGRASRGQQSVGSFLRPAIARGDILTIAECTPAQISAIERNDPHLLAAFVQLTIPERTPAQIRAILERIFTAAPGSLLPDQLAGASAALDRLHQLHQRYAIYSANPGRPIRFLRNLLSDHPADKALTDSEVTTAFSRETGLPAVLLNDRISLDLVATHGWFSQRIVGQPEAVACMVDLLAVIKARLARPRKPLASFLFIGPTGTGKTELARVLAEFLFGDAARMARFDLNQFNNPLALQRLIGGPLAGGKEGLLTARVREQPFSVLLLDEFEKVDPGFFDLLLQILGDGRLTDASGRVADFCNCVIVMTSNLGAEGYQRGPSGFRADGAAAPNAQEHFTDAVRKFLRPEIFGRLDAVVPFHPLSHEAVLEIARKQIIMLRQRDGLRLRPIDLTILPAVADYLAERGFDARYGARPLKRAIERELLIPLAEVMSDYGEKQPLSIRAGVDQEEIRFTVKAISAAKTADLAAKTMTSAPSENTALPGSIVAQRRLVTRLKACSATSELENQVAITESLERRLEKTKWRNPEQQKRLARLPKLRECLAAIAQLHDRIRQLESDVLSVFYQRESVEDAMYAPELAALVAERQRLLRDVFRLRLEEPDEVIIAVYGENRNPLLELASAYHDLAAELGKVIAFDYFLPPAGGRSTASRPIRNHAKSLEEPFKDLPEAMIGVVMHVRGDLFLPRFEGEAGLHLFKDKGTEHSCLVETGAGPFDKYQPPQGIERKGHIEASGAPVLRRFDCEKEIVSDTRQGDRPWRGGLIERCMRELMEQHLNDSMEAITR